MKDQELLKIIQEYSYAGIFVWFALVQLIFPIPQEIALISIGYITTHIHINIIFSILFSTVGIVASDMLLFYLSRSGSKITKRLMDKFNQSWIDKTTGKLDKHSFYTLFILLLLPEARLLAPLLSGVTSLSVKKFIFVDLLANLLMCTVYIILGKFFYSTLKELGSKLDGYKHLIFIGVMIAAALVIIIFLRNKYLKNK